MTQRCDGWRGWLAGQLGWNGHGYEVAGHLKDFSVRPCKTARCCGDAR
jgi:hypothetical protein